MIGALLLFALVAVAAFGWGMYAQEIITKRGTVKARERRIVIDAPFSLEQSEIIMRVLKELNDAVSNSMDLPESPGLPPGAKELVD